jgi:hypothetical protein
MAYMANSRAEDIDGLRALLSSELTNRSKALRLIEEGDASTLTDAWGLLVALGEIDRSEVPARYRVDV